MEEDSVINQSQVMDFYMVSGELEEAIQLKNVKLILIILMEQTLLFLMEEDSVINQNQGLDF